MFDFFTAPVKQEKDIDDGENADDGEKETKSKSKAQYSGGLVLEPKKGGLSLICIAIAAKRTVNSGNP